MRLFSTVGLLFFLVAAGCSQTGSVGGEPSGGPATEFIGEVNVRSLSLKSGRVKTVSKGAFVTVTGDNESLDGELSFEGGATLVFKNDVTLNGTFSKTEANKGEQAIVVVAEKGLVVGGKFSYTAPNSVKIVSKLADADTDDVLIADASVDKGPVIDGNIVGNIPPVTLASALEKAQSPQINFKPMMLPTWNVQGNFAPLPTNRTRPFVFYIFPRNHNVDFVDVHVTVPDGLHGTDETKAGTATAGDANQIAPALNVKVPDGSFTATSFTVKLAAGGDGGDAIATSTQQKCDATALGGKGGPSGNFKISAKGSITIKSMTITPGRSGDGGNATATGCDRPICVGIGGNATATGGTGANNRKVLRTRGVTGVENIVINKVKAGIGGFATATSGKGSDNDPVGSAGGVALATPGKGGTASLTADVDATVEDGADGVKTEVVGATGADITCTGTPAADDTAGGTSHFETFTGAEYTSSGSCSLADSVMTFSGGNVVLTPFYTSTNSDNNPGGVTFSADGNQAQASDVTMFDMPDHTVDLVIDDSGTITVTAYSSTGSCSDTLTAS